MKTPTPKKRSLWTCPKCGKKFVSRNAPHSCGNFPIDDLFIGKPPELRKLYDQYVRFVKRVCGPVLINVDRTRMTFQARMRFAGMARVRKDALVGGFILKYRIESPRFTKVEFIRPSYWVYNFLIRSVDDLDDEVADWLTQAYKVGKQEVKIAWRKK